MQASVLLVEDDPSIVRLLAMALDGMGIDLLHSESVREARAKLADDAPGLILTDLTLTDGSALEFIEDTARRGIAPIVVFSAGVTPALEQRLLGAGVRRVLHKPVDLATLQSCVTEALSAGPGCVETFAQAGGREAVLSDFGGDTALFHAFWESCKAQFPRDIEHGDHAVARGDRQEVRRLAHNLKSVLLLLGDTGASALARRLEEDAAQDRSGDLRLGWQLVRDAVRKLLARGPDSTNADGPGPCF